MPDASKDATSEGRDYKDTLFLPETQFPMRAGLPKAEPQWLKRWADMDMYKRLREAAKGRTKYILHDGPPYANGHLHMGHAFNKVLKDLVVRSRQMLGYDANYVPGWDCHGLPIEWKIEERYRAQGKRTICVDGDAIEQGVRHLVRDDVVREAGEHHGPGAPARIRIRDLVDIITTMKVILPVGHSIAKSQLKYGMPGFTTLRSEMALRFQQAKFIQARLMADGDHSKIIAIP